MREKLTDEEVVYLTKIASRLKEQTGWRYGQCLFNTLYDVDKEMANEVRGVPDIDPYFEDKNIPGFFNYLTGFQINVDPN